MKKSKKNVTSVKNRGSAKETKSKLELTDFEDFKDEIFGKRGTEKREEYEWELKIELLGEFLRAFREKNKVTQGAIAKYLKTDTGTISKLENNLKTPRIDTIAKYINAMNAELYLVVKKEKLEEKVQLV